MSFRWRLHHRLFDIHDHDLIIYSFRFLFWHYSNVYTSSCHRTLYFCIHKKYRKPFCLLSCFLHHLFNSRSSSLWPRSESLRTRWILIEGRVSRYACFRKIVSLLFRKLNRKLTAPKLQPLDLLQNRMDDHCSSSNIPPIPICFWYRPHERLHLHRW